MDIFPIFFNMKVYEGHPKSLSNATLTQVTLLIKIDQKQLTHNTHMRARYRTRDITVWG